jgi:hypothetical protein
LSVLVIVSLVATLVSASAQDGKIVPTSNENPKEPVREHVEKKDPGGGPKTKELPLEATPVPREVRHDGNHIEVRIPVARVGTGYVTVVELPEKAIKNVLVHFKDDEISLEHVESKVFVKLLKRAEGYLDVVGTSGTLYRLLVRPVTGGAFDGTVRVKCGREKPALSGPEAKNNSKRSTPEALQLVRAMRLSQGMDGVDVFSIDQVLDRDDSIEARAVYVFETPRMVGYVVKFTNLGNEAIRVDLSRFAGPTLVAAATREFVVEGKKHTYLYFVFGRQP